MSQATDLLNRLTNEQILAYSADPESEPHIVIGADRFITVPKSLKRVAVQYDHDVETVVFDCPRYWDNLDMSMMAVYINYVLSDGYADSYPADNVTADGDIMHFTWTISRNVTQVTGNITFLVCVKKTDAEGKEINHWNSELCRDMYVSEGLETEEQIAMENSDLITQLLLRMNSVEQINVTAETMDGYVEEITTARDDAAETLTNINNSAAVIRNSYANAIKGNVSGEIVRVDDVSPLEHDVVCRVHGKNLFDISKIPTTTASVSSAYVSEVGADYVIVSTLEGYTGNGYCTVPVKVRDACPTMQVGKTYILKAATESDSSNIYLPGLQRSWVFGTTMVATEELLNSTMTLYGFSMGSGLGPGECRISNIQIEEGTVATAYEPYIDLTDVEVIRYGKNLVDSTQYISPKTVNGVTVQYLPNEDVFLFNGTATAAARIGYSQLIGACNGEQFTCTIIPLSGTVDKGNADYPPVIFFGKSETRTSAGTNNISFPFTNTKTSLTQRVSGKYLKDSWFWIGVGNVLNNYKVRIQFEHGDTATSYEPYKNRNVCSATETGVANTLSVYPTVTMLTNTDGAIIEAEYNRDTTKMFESYVLTDEAKDEIAAKVEGDMAEVLASLNSYAQSVIGGDG